MWATPRFLGCRHHLQHVLKQRAVVLCAKATSTVPDPSPSQKRAKPDLWTFVSDELLSNMSDTKRKIEASSSEAGPDAKKSRGTIIHVQPQRVRTLKNGTVGSGPVIYWYGKGVACVNMPCVFCSYTHNTQDVP